MRVLPPDLRAFTQPATLCVGYGFRLLCVDYGFRLLCISYGFRLLCVSYGFRLVGVGLDLFEKLVVGARLNIKPTFEAWPT